MTGTLSISLPNGLTFATLHKHQCYYYARGTKGLNPFRQVTGLVNDSASIQGSFEPHLDEGPLGGGSKSVLMHLLSTHTHKYEPKIV